jgi:hypothetical protein
MADLTVVLVILEWAKEQKLRALEVNEVEMFRPGGRFRTSLLKSFVSMNVCKTQ